MAAVDVVDEAVAAEVAVGEEALADVVVVAAAGVVVVEVAGVE